VRSNLVWAGVLLLLSGPACWLFFRVGQPSSPAVQRTPVATTWQPKACTVSTVANGGVQLAHPTVIVPGVYTDAFDRVQLQHSLIHGARIVFYPPPLTATLRANLNRLPRVVAVPQTGLPIGRLQAAKLGSQIVCPVTNADAWQDIQTWLAR
jgi:hypothetical protein